MNIEQDLAQLKEDAKKYQEDLHEVLMKIALLGNPPTQKGSIMLVDTKTGKYEEFKSIEQASNKTGIFTEDIEDSINTGKVILGYVFKQAPADTTRQEDQDLVTYPTPDNGVRYTSVLMEYPNGEQRTVSSIKEASDIIGCPRQSLSYLINKSSNHIAEKNGFKVVAQVGTIDLP